MKRSLFTPHNTPDDTNKHSLESILSGFSSSEIAAKYHQSQLDLEEVWLDATTSTVESLTHTTSVLDSEEVMDGPNFQVLMGSVRSASERLGGELSIESITHADFNKDKSAHIAELETTVEGFIADIKASIKRTYRKIVKSTKNFFTTLVNKQMHLKQLSTTLRNRMKDKKGISAKGKTVYTAGGAKWFNNPEEVSGILETYNQLTKTLPDIFVSLKEIPTLVREGKANNDQIIASVDKHLQSLNKVKGVKSINNTEGDIKTNGVEIPGPSGINNLFIRHQYTGKKTVLPSGTMLAMISGLGLYAMGSGVFVAAGVAFGVKVVADEAQIQKSEMPLMGWKQMEQVFNAVAEMSTTDFTLKGLAATFSVIEKQVKALNDKSTAPGKALESVSVLIDIFSDLYRGVYKNSVESARAAVAYATSSLKVHLMAQDTQEHRMADDDLYKDVVAINKTFDQLDAI